MSANAKDLHDALLIVEDNPDDLHLLQRSLRKTGSSIPVRTAADGQAALEYLGAYQAGTTPDRLLAILLDLKLPRVSGFEILAMVKEHPKTQAVPVVVLTSSGEGDDIRNAYRLGANSYLRKPADPGDLTALVSSIERYWLQHNLSP